MPTMTREQAVKGAGERLTRLEEGMRKLFYVAIATAAMAGITTSISLFGAYRYWQVTTSLSRSYDELKTSLGRPDVRRISRQP